MLERVIDFGIQHGSSLTTQLNNSRSYISCSYIRLFLCLKYDSFKQSSGVFPDLAKYLSFCRIREGLVDIILRKPIVFSDDKVCDGKETWQILTRIARLLVEEYGVCGKSCTGAYLYVQLTHAGSTTACWPRCKRGPGRRTKSIG